ncbi:hypothetical protein F2Q69_00038053 [Brassica cretica]|uniref:Uncharacterized protein n=1 Tax=Brassica cretica TaxID=69181 RepID=A0A8S9SK90_BRACR|nr:hypothetical protein F2Q69_00038053 [Brassica cretica]
MFHQLRWYYILVIYICAPVLAFCNAYGAGLTDWSLASTYGKLAIFTIGAWAGSEHGGMLAGLAACGVMMNIVSTASDLTQDFKTGYLTLSSPKSMFVSQVIGTAMGCVVSPCVFWLFYKAFDDLGIPNSEYPAPFATVYRSMAKLGVEGVASLPRECLVLCYAFFSVAILVNIVKDSLPSRWGRFVPLPMAMAIPFFLGPYFAIDMCVGSLALFVWERVDAAKAEAFGTAVASGLICGDGIWSFPSSVLAIAGVNPPVSTGNAKANQYWESELPLHFERSSSDSFIRAKYNEKKWVSPGGIQPSPIASQLSCKVSHLVESGYKPATPKKARTLSLDEDLLLKHVLQVTPPETRIRAGSVDMKENVYALPLPVGMEAKKPNQKNEIFSGEMYQNRSTTIAPPSSWATFDCWQI